MILVELERRSPCMGKNLRLKVFRKLLEARVGVEPTYKGFADLFAVLKEKEILELVRRFVRRQSTQNTERICL
jgi:hypothetical protein